MNGAPDKMKGIPPSRGQRGAGDPFLQLIHGFNRGTNLRSMIYDWYRYDAKVKRIIPGDNPGITVLVLKELY